MSVPKRRKTKSRRNQRRANIFIRSPLLTSCKKCNQAILSYTVCQNCGYYKGVEIIDVFKKLTKKEKKEKEKEIKAAEAEKRGEKVLNLEELSRK
jgi:large subunit ribosomal protein L32